MLPANSQPLGNAQLSFVVFERQIWLSWRKEHKSPAWKYWHGFYFCSLLEKKNKVLYLEFFCRFLTYKSVHKAYDTYNLQTKARLLMGFLQAHYNYTWTIVNREGSDGSTIKKREAWLLPVQDLTWWELCYSHDNSKHWNYTDLLLGMQS